MKRLVIENGPDQGRAISLNDSDVYSVGRDPAASLPLSDERTSRVHFKLRLKDGIVYIKDQNSTNGTLVNGEPIRETRGLKKGDRIQVGDTVLVVEDVAPRSSAPERSTRPETAASPATKPAGRAESSPAPAPAPQAVATVSPATKLAETASKAAAESDEEKREAGALQGKVIGGYQITGRLGRGGRGVVYRATQLSLNREVALKILSKKLTQDPVFIERFIREARSAAQLNHPNVVQIFDAGNESDVYYISMELMEGGTLQTLIDAEGKLPAARVMQYAIDAARALVYAQKKGIVHRDVKPDNLMISEAGAAKVADLGLARHLEKGPAGGGSEEGGVFGTPHFVSPEQAQGLEVDTRSDIYSLGATLYYMLTGLTPFHGKSAAEIVSQQIKARPQPLREIDPEIPEDVAAAVERMLQKDREARHASAVELFAELEQIQRSHHYGGAGRLSTAAKVGIAAVVLVAAAAVAWVVTHPKTVEIAGPSGNSDPIVIEKDNPELKLKLREKEAQVSFSEAQIFERDHGRTEETAERYDSVARAFSDTEAGRQAASFGEAIRTALAEAKRSEEARAARLDQLVAGLSSECATALSSGRFGAAYASVASSPAFKELAGTPREAEALAMLDGVRGKASDAVERFVESARSLNAPQEIGPAIESARRLAEDLVLPAEVGTAEDRRLFGDLASKLSDSVDGLEKRRATGELAVRDRDRDLFFAAAREALSLEDSLRFDEAATRLAAVEGKLVTQAYGRRARSLKEETERIARLKSRLVESVASGPLAGQELPLARETNGIRTGRATGADSNGITLEISVGQGRSLQTTPWDAYPRTLFLEILKDKIATDPPSRLALVELALHLGLSSEAKSLAEALEQEGGPGAAEAAQLKGRASQELDAAQRIATIRTQFDKGQFQAALRGIEELRAGFAETRVFLVNSSGASHYCR